MTVCLLSRFLSRNYEGQALELEVFLRHCLRAYPCKMQVLLRELTSELSQTAPVRHVFVFVCHVTSVLL